MQFDACNYRNPHNDRFILSKGHAAPLLYAAWKEVGVLTEKDILSLRKFDSVLEGHPTPRFPYVEAATGSLGQGLSVAIGFALSARLDNLDFYTYVLLGDGEVAEGSVWEAAELAAYYKLDHIIAILDCNRLGQSAVTMAGHDVEQYLLKFGAFGWHVIIVDGHDMREVVQALDQARAVEGMPTIIVAKTRKGHGLPATIEDQPGFHGKAFTEKELPVLLAHLEKQFPDAAAYAESFDSAQDERKGRDEHPQKHSHVTMAQPMYLVTEKLATRKAYGEALTILGTVAKQVVSLDGDVKNSTYAEIFEQAFPKRFFQCFVAEQNMVSMGVGFVRCHKIPFISTFGCFFTRAHDQIRMAAIGKVPLRLVGSHAGVSIGEDGPSQMALEDIALMRALPGSVVLYPCDAVSAYKLVNCMANYHDGISYLRTTRGATPILYDNCEEFAIGGLKVLYQDRQDQVCIVTAGITVFEAISAYEQLKKENILCTVIDCYSVKPLDEKSLIEHATRAGKKLITVEDHYLQGGLGEAITYAVRNENIEIECLAVTKLPRSGTSQELLRFEEIDAATIAARVKSLIKK